MTTVPLYCIDTHAQYWQVVDRARLSAAAMQVFDDVKAGRARFLLPHVVIAELFYLFQKQGQSTLFPQFITHIRSSPAYLTEPASLDDLEKLPAFSDVSEMHDRLIVIQASRLGAAIITKDVAMHASSHARCIW